MVAVEVTERHPPDRGRVDVRPLERDEGGRAAVEQHRLPTAVEVKAGLKAPTAGERVATTEKQDAHRAHDGGFNRPQGYDWRMCSYQEWERVARHVREAVDEGQAWEFVAEATARIEALVDELKGCGCAIDNADWLGDRAGDPVQSGPSSQQLVTVGSMVGHRRVPTQSAVRTVERGRERARETRAADAAEVFGPQAGDA